LVAPHATNTSPLPCFGQEPEGRAIILAARIRRDFCLSSSLVVYFVSIDRSRLSQQVRSEERRLFLRRGMVGLLSQDAAVLSAETAISFFTSLKHGRHKRAARALIHFEVNIGKCFNKNRLTSSYSKQERQYSGLTRSTLAFSCV
jgi:hypothetical protein